MRGSRKCLLAAGCIFGVLAGILTTGCAGPSTRVLPRAETEQAVYDLPENNPVLEEANSFYLQEALAFFSETPRPGGSGAEGAAARYMEQLLSDYGYQVKRQRFRTEGAERMITGTNVEAVRKAGSESDILIICTHHDTLPDTPGANSSAAGIVTILETARLLSKFPTDTELRFVSFSGHETGGLGARYYADSLTRREKDRIVGVVNLAEIGYLSDIKVILETLDGKPTCLGDQIKQACGEVLGESWPYETGHDPEISSFHAVQLPILSLRQESASFEHGTPMDRTEIVDVERLAQIVDVLGHALSELMSTDSPSMITKARYYNDYRDEAYVQRREDLLQFGESLELVENYVGIRGILDATNQDSSGKMIEKYQFRMKWFDVDQIILSDYYFLDGKLDVISLEADQAGVVFDEMKERLTGIYGEPEEKSQGPNGTEYDWKDSVYHKKYALIPTSGSYQLEIRDYAAEKEILLQRGMDGKILSQIQADERTPMLMTLLNEIFPEEAKSKIGAVTFYRDGIGDTQSYLVPMLPQPSEGETHAGAPGGEDALWEIGIDVDDAMLPGGHLRDRTATLKELTALYGRYLQASAPENYQFPEEEPERFAEYFSAFVLCIRPDRQTGAFGERILPYYEREELTAYRDWVRKNLRLHTETSELVSPDEMKETQ